MTLEKGGTKRSASEISNNENSGKSTVDNSTMSSKHSTDDDGPYKCLPIHGEHKRAVSCLSFAPTIRNNIHHPLNDNDNIICASASADGSVRLWDITRYIREDTNMNSNNSEEDMDVDVAGGSDSDGGLSSILKSNQSNKKSHPILPVCTITGHTRGINDIAWSPRTPSLIATASDDKTLRIWDVTRSSTSSSQLADTSANSKAAKANMNNYSTTPNSVGHPSTGTGFENDAATDSITDALVEFKGHSNFCFSVKFSPQGNLLVSGSFDETVKVWDVRTGECVSTLPAHSDPVTGVDFNTDGTCIVSSSHDGLMRIWDVATGECLKTIYAEGNPPVTFVKYSPNGKYVLSGMLDGKLRLWNVTGDCTGGAARGAAASGVNSFSSLDNEHKQPKLQDYLSIGLTSAQGRAGQCTKTYSGHVNSKYCIFSEFSVSNPKRHSVVTGSEDGKVYVYDLQTRNVRQVLDGHNDACLTVAVHDQKEIFASGGMSEDRLVKFWIPNDNNC